MKLNTYKMILICGAFLGCNIALANNSDDISQVSRYMTVDNKPNKSQMDLLSQVVQIRFPQNIQTIGEATQYLLQFSGYSLVDASQMSTSLKTLLSKPLPVVDRELGPISLEQGLITLTGTTFTLNSDPINRTINFTLKPAFAKTYALNTQKSHVANRG